MVGINSLRGLNSVSVDIQPVIRAVFEMPHPFLQR